jgi:signal peptidase I
MSDRREPGPLGREGASKEQPAAKGWFAELIESILPALTVVLAVNFFLAQPRVVHGASMEPSLHNDERVIVDVLSFRFREPERGEIIILDLDDPTADTPLIKRVIGVPGDVVAIHDGSVYLNGQLLDEPYLDVSTPGTLGPEVVPADHVFVLGDNRVNSNDSRYFGMVPYNHIRGRALLRYWPLDDLTLFTRP